MFTSLREFMAVMPTDEVDGPPDHAADAPRAPGDDGPPPPAHGGPLPPAPPRRRTTRRGAEPARGVFITKESLTFPGSATLVSFLLQLAGIPFKGADSSFFWALGISAVIGAFIYYLSLTRRMDGREKVIAAGIAAINVLVLTGTALGVDALGAQAGVGVGSGGPSPSP